MKSNCLIFAFSQWWKRGGYLVVRLSHWGWWPHIIYSKDLKNFEEFHPCRKKQHHLFPPLIFSGYVRHSTANEQSETG
jgi:hypothetical protein